MLELTRAEYSTLACDSAITAIAVVSEPNAAPKRFPPNGIVAVEVRVLDAMR